uniref:Uncharacterized protein n=1 Tax=Chenopodium quinoa TaxID=63459 RepID=A0A803M2Q9_CHEQI
MCATMGYDGAFYLIDDDEDASSMLSIVEKNTGAHVITPNNFRRPIYLDDLSDDEDLHVAQLKHVSRHFKPSYLEDENPLEALIRKEKEKDLVEEKDEETEEKKKEEIEEDPKEKDIEEDLEDGNSEEELLEDDNDSEGCDEGSQKRSRVEDFDLDFDVLCYRRCSYIRAQLLFPITNREFILILMSKLTVFFYRHMVSVKNIDLSHMKRHGFEVNAYRLQERRPHVNPQGEMANRRILTRIDKPLSVVYDRLSKKGILQVKSYVYSLPPHGTDMRQYCSYYHQYGHRKDVCYDLKCAIQDLID